MILARRVIPFDGDGLAEADAALCELLAELRSPDRAGFGPPGLFGVPPRR
jgi:hypothetical protein